MNSLYSLFDRYIEVEINRKLNQRLDDLQEHLLTLNPDYMELIIEAVKKQRYRIQSVLRLDSEKKKRRKNQIDEDHRCLARTCFDTQCRRPRIEGTRYCQSHTYSLPYNDIESKTDIQQKLVKKRGRRGKGKVFETADLDPEKYIPAVAMQIGDHNYLVDHNDIIYNFNQNNEIVGYIKEDQVYWF